MPRRTFSHVMWHATCKSNLNEALFNPCVSPSRDGVHRFCWQIREMTVTKLLATFRKIVTREEGATMVEYGLMLALIAVICLAAVTSIGTGSSTMFNSVSASL
jgi:pilus assembly protein Flp/PilA